MSTPLLSAESATAPWPELVGQFVKPEGLLDISIAARSHFLFPRVAERGGIGAGAAGQGWEGCGDMAALLVKPPPNPENTSGF